MKHLIQNEKSAMNFKRKFVTICVLLTFFTLNTALSQVLLPSKGLGSQLSLNGAWKFKYIPSSNIGYDENFFQPQINVSQWANIITPGHWELQGFAEPKYGKELQEGTGLYRTSFVVPANWKKQPIYIAFDGVQYGYQFWVNGKFVGSFNSSYNRRTFDITPFVNLGRNNTLAVRVSTRSKGWEFDTNDCWSLSGIIRDVTLFTLPPTHLKDVVIRTNVNKADATLSVSALIEHISKKFVPKHTNVVATLHDPNGKLVKKFSLVQNRPTSISDTASFYQRIKIEKPKLWTAEAPNLYTLSISLKSKNKELQQHVEKVGIREITWNDGILRLNGSPIKLRGGKPS